MEDETPLMEDETPLMEDETPLGMILTTEEVEVSEGFFKTLPIGYGLIRSDDPEGLIYYWDPRHLKDWAAKDAQKATLGGYLPGAPNRYTGECTWTIVERNVEKWEQAEITHELEAAQKGWR